MEPPLATQPEKPHFPQIYARSGIGYGMIDTIAEVADVPRYVLNEMLLGNPVARTDAEKVLSIISHYTGKAWTLETVAVPVLPEALTMTTTHATKPTFQQLREQCHFDIVALAHQANVLPQMVYSMLLGQPVSRNDAAMVLKAYSEHVGSLYTLDTTAVPLKKA